jgi:TonB-linked SusC/RagA family outer membrane protein
MRKALLLAIAFVFMLSGWAYAQGLTVNGVVTDGGDGSPLPGVNVVVKGTATGTVTDIDGKYSIQVSSGAILVFSYVGYQNQEVTVGSETTINVALALDATALEEVVVTALGIERDKRSLGYSVTQVDAAKIGSKPDADVGRILGGKIAGVNVTSTSGVSGSGTNIIIRGLSSMTGSNQPMFVVDGVPFNANTNSQGSFTEDGLGTSSRFLDLDPNNIESVDVLKGLAAATLYGSQGRNGVVLITTKNGSAGKGKKDFEVTLNQSYFVNQIASLPVYQNSYGAGFHQNPGFFFSNWGAHFDDVGVINHPFTTLGDASLRAAFPDLVGSEYEYKAYTGPEDFFQDGRVSVTGVNISGGQGDSRYNASFAYHDETGFTPNNTLVKYNFGLGGSTKMGDKLTVSSSFNFVITEQRTPPISASGGSSASGDGISVFGDVFYTPRSVDLMGIPFESPVDGRSVYYRSPNDIMHPRWTVKNARQTDDVRRFFGRTSLNYEIVDGLSLSYRLGLDTYSENISYLVNKGGVHGANPAIQLGLYRTTNMVNTIWDNTLMLNFDRDLTDKISLSANFGGNVRSDQFSRDGIESTNQVVFGFVEHSNFTNHSSVNSFTGGDLQYREEQAIMGLFGQVSLGINDYAYVNVAARNDWASTVEPENRSIFYPSVSASFIPTAAFPNMSNKVLSYMKVRAGYGTSAGFPSPYSTRSTLSTGARSYINNVGQVVITNSLSDFLGNPNLKPELHGEFELGLEAKLFDSRIGIEVSLYNKNTTNLITDAPLDPATGYTSTSINIGKIQNQGVEIAMNATPVQKGGFSWVIDANFTAYETTVKELGGQLEEVAYAGYSNLGNFAIPGQPLGVIKGSYIVRDSEGRRMVDGTGNYVVSDDIGVIGDPNPDFLLGVTNTLTYKGLSFGFQIDYRHGGDIYSTTTAALLARGLTKDTDFDRTLPVILPGVKADGTPNDIQLTSTTAYFSNIGFGPDEVSVYDGTTIRLREVSLSYAVPKAVMAKTPFGRASITFSGQNLWFRAVNFPKYVNFDTDVVGTGVGNGYGLEFLTGPSARKYGVSLKLTF